MINADAQVMAAIEAGNTNYRRHIGPSSRFSVPNTGVRVITETQVRLYLLNRASIFCREHKTSFSAIGMKAIGDSKFLSRVKAGLGFTVDTYQRVVEWLDAQEAKEAAQ